MKRSPGYDEGTGNGVRMVVILVIAFLALLVTLTAAARPPAADDAVPDGADIHWKEQLKDFRSYGPYLAERAGDNSRYRLSRRLKRGVPPQIAACSGYANEHQLRARGRPLGLLSERSSACRR